MSCHTNFGRRGCGRSSVSNRLVAELAGDDLPYVRLFDDRKRKEQLGLIRRIYMSKSKSKSYLSKRLIVRHRYNT